METRKHNILSRFFNTGMLDRTKLQDDVDRMTAFYYNHGYLQVHIGDPAITPPRQFDHRHGDDRRRPGLHGRQGRRGRRPEVSQERPDFQAHAQAQQGLQRRRHAARRADALGLLFRPRLRVRQRRSAHPGRPRGASGQRHVRDHPGQRGPDRPHQDLRQHQDLGQGDPARDQGAGAGALFGVEDPDLQAAPRLARLFLRACACQPSRRASPTR